MVSHIRGVCCSYVAFWSSQTQPYLNVRNLLLWHRILVERHTGGLEMLQISQFRLEQKEQRFAGAALCASHAKDQVRVAHTHTRH